MRVAPEGEKRVKEGEQQGVMGDLERFKQKTTGLMSEL